MYAVVHVFGMLLACFEEAPLHPLSMLYSYMTKLCILGKTDIRRIYYHLSQF